MGEEGKRGMLRYKVKQKDELNKLKQQLRAV